jgi:hypothetical protein
LPQNQFSYTLGSPPQGPDPGGLGETPLSRSLSLIAQGLQWRNLLAEAAIISETSSVTPLFLWRRLQLLAVLERRRKSSRVLVLVQAPQVDEWRNVNIMVNFSVGSSVTPSFCHAASIHTLS